MLIGNRLSAADKRRLAMLYANNQGGNLRQQLLDGAPFLAELTHTAVPQRAAPGTTGTFTRATTATVRDHEGVLRTAIAGEARFEGARRVRNLIAGSSENLTNASWGNINATSPDARTILASAGTAPHHRYNLAATAVAGNTYVIQAKLTAGTHRYACIGDRGDAVYRSVSFDLQAGTKGAEHNATGTIEDLGGGQYLCTAKFTRTTGGTTINPAVGVIGSSSDFIENAFNAAGTETIIAEEIQLEDITGRADQTTPSEYVSVGVLSAPYHGAGVDGVRYFDTDINGTPIPASTLKGYMQEGARTNLCRYSQSIAAGFTFSGTCIGTDNVGTYAGVPFTRINNATGGASYLICSYTGDGTKAFSVLLKKDAAVTGAYSVGFYDNTAAAVRGYVTATIASDGSMTFAAFSGCAVTSSELLADGVYLLKGTVSGIVAANTNFYYANFSIGTATSCLVSAMQTEDASFASSYIPTTTAAVTRNAEIEAYSTANNITAAAGYISLQFTPTHTPSGTIALWGTYVDASNYTAILHDATNLIFRKRIAGSNYDATIANAFASGTTYKVAATWGAAGTSIALDGTLGTGHANTTAAQIAATMQFGADGNSLQQPFASVGVGYIGQRQLSASEMQAVTS